MSADELVSRLDTIIELLREISEGLKHCKPRQPGKRERVLEPPKVDPKIVLSMYNEILGPKLGHVQFLTDYRKRLIVKMEQKGVDKVELWRQYFLQIMESPFLMGVNQHNWLPNIEWIMDYNNFVKVMEGRYKQRASLQLPEAYASAVNTLKAVANGEHVQITNTARSAEILADIHAALVMYSMTNHVAYSALLKLVEEQLKPFAHLITSRKSLEKRQLAAAIVYAIKGTV